MNTKLGRGLDALISTGAESIDRNTGTATLKIDVIRPNPYQPRITFDPEKLNELANSLAESGMIQPIIVTKNADSEYELIAGERRLEAAKIAGFVEVPVIIRCVSPREQLQFALIENIQRDNLNPIEEALAYRQLKEQFDLTHQEIAKSIGKDRVTVTNSVRLLKLVQEAQDLISGGMISAGHGRALLQLEEHQQMPFAELIIKNNYSVRETERKVKKTLEDVVVEVVEIDEERIDYINDIQKQLRKSLAVPVRIKDKEQKGTIAISYRNEKELQAVLERLLLSDN